MLSAAWESFWAPSVKNESEAIRQGQTPLRQNRSGHARASPYAIGLEDWNLQNKFNLSCLLGIIKFTHLDFSVLSNSIICIAFKNKKNANIPGFSIEKIKLITLFVC